MTRQDFILIAEIIRDRVPPGDVEQVAAVFAQGLGATHPRFKADLFMQVATGKLPSSARRAR